MSEHLDAITIKVAEALMKSHGWDEASRGTSKIEWSLEEKDSQFSLAMEDAQIAVEAFVAALDGVGDEGDEDEDHATQLPLFDEEPKVDVNGEPYTLLRPRRTQTVTRKNALFIFMDAGIGNPSYVRDVRDWLQAVDDAGIPNETEVDGTLHLSYDLDIRNVERIECLDYGKKDVLLTIHECSRV